MGKGERLEEFAHALGMGQAAPRRADRRGLLRRGGLTQRLGPRVDAERLEEAPLRDRPVDLVPPSRVPLSTHSRRSPPRISFPHSSLS